MTETIFHTDAAVREFDAAVVSADVDAGTVTLDRTAFFPGGGGQPHDLGHLAWNGHEAAVTKVKWGGGGVVHHLEGSLPEAGTSVRGVLDWDRRYALMRTHTALHILCGVVWRDYGAQVTGGNMEPLRGRLDFEFEHMSAELADEIEVKLADEVAAARDVRVAILPRDDAFQIPDLIRTKVNLLPESLTEIRTIEIVGLDLQADGGTHVANTREVGAIRIAGYESKGRINKRVRIELDP
jgi:misacylated tRNA(Ala) deacylase